MGNILNPKPENVRASDPKNNPEEYDKQLSRDL